MFWMIDVFWKIFKQLSSFKFVKVVLNTSPIIFLSKVECLTLLTDCCAEIYVPLGVVDELHDYRLPEKIKTRLLSSEGVAYVKGALGRLHLGELEAIMLAHELSVDYVILDDLLARRKAQHLGVDAASRPSGATLHAGPN